MPKIVIQEKDETTIQEANLLTDIVFIPGFADTNNNVYVLENYADVPGVGDEDWEGHNLPGTVIPVGKSDPVPTFQTQYYKDGNEIKTLPRRDRDGTLHRIVTPQYAVNVQSKRVWGFFAADSSVKDGKLGSFVLGQNTLQTTGWVEILKPEMLSQLLPENYPTLVTTVAEFRKNFGTEPYQFESDQPYPQCVVPPTISSTEEKMYKEGEYDKSYIMANEYLRRGLCVMYYNVVTRTKDGIKEDSASPMTSDNTHLGGMFALQIYDELEKKIDEEDEDEQGVLAMLTDRNMFSVKYITSGGYPTFELDQEYQDVCYNMVELAKTRGDCVAIIDHFNNPLRKLTGTDSVYDTLKTTYSSLESEFAAMFTPWATYSTTSGTISMPGSYAYMTALATAIQSYPNYLAVAGTSRGQLPTLIDINSIYAITNKIANDYQPRDDVAINPITLITPYGYTIWGNRTLFDNAQGNLTARSFLNIRNMVSDIKKQAYVVAKRLMFEQDSDVLWLRFKMGITPLLDSMKTGNGLSDYRVIRTTTKYDGTPLNKGEIAAVIRIFPKYAIEDWEITVVISDEEVTVE